MGISDSLRYFLWLCSMMPSLLLYAWPVSVGLMLFSAIAFGMWLKGKVALNWKWLIRPLPITIAILMYGTAFRANHEYWPLMSQLKDYVVLALLLLQLVASGAAIYRAPSKTKLVSAAILVWGFYLSLSAAFIASMSVTGDWL